MFGIGDDVVCIEDFSANIFSMPGDKGDMPVKGSGYKIRDMYKVQNPHDPNVYVHIIRLEGMYCYARTMSGEEHEAWYNARYFRPATKLSKDTSIDIFRDIDKKVFDGTLGNPDEAPVKKKKDA